MTKRELASTPKANRRQQNGAAGATRCCPRHAGIFLEEEPGTVYSLWPRTCPDLCGRHSSSAQPQRAPLEL